MEMRVTYTIEESRAGTNLTRLKLLAGDTTGDTTGEYLLEKAKLFLIATAQETLKEEQQKGFDKNPVTYVDNKEGRPLTAVKPWGKIEYFSRLNAMDFILSVYKEIQRLSKIVTGQYRKWNLILLNGRVIAGDLPTAEKFAKSAVFKPGDLIQFVNINAYARRLEYLGVTSQGSGRKMVKNIITRKKGRGRVQSGRRPMRASPNGAYYLAFKTIGKNSKMMGSNKIKFEFIHGSKIQGIPVAGQRTTFSTRKWGMKRGGRPYLYPCISLTIKSGTIG